MTALREIVLVETKQTSRQMESEMCVNESNALCRFCKLKPKRDDSMSGIGWAGTFSR